MKLFLVVAALVAAVSAFSYNGYRVLEVGPLNDVEKAKLVVSLVDDDETIREVLLLNEYVIASKPIYLAVAPQAFLRVSGFLDQHGFSFVITDDDLQRSFDNAKAENMAAQAKWRESGSRASPTAYLRYADQVAWLQSAAAGSSIASTFSIGRSYEGRDMVGISINAGNTALPAIWIDSNTHAREWIGGATTLYIIDQILSGTSADAIYLRNNFRWYFLPTANPDGYEYTWTGDRLWRKTRSNNAGSVCVGTDPNRNWDVNWCGEGASTSPCSDTYCGSAPFSEVENQHIRDYLRTIAGSTNVYISYHAYSQLWLMPWGSYSYKPVDYSELLRVGNLAVDAIYSVNGLRFQAGTPPDLLYVASGGSFDYVKATLGIKYAYSPELRPATEIQGGFDIPPSNINPSGAENFAGLVAVARNVQHKL
jgi:murein tripeptide amidase MpaA